ncbi:MAG: hypothetical protein IJZ70_04610 [Bacteroidales bacterium]|nr:hypothetical protein [Bacteroidales bacterium]
MKKIYALIAAIIVLAAVSVYLAINRDRNDSLFDANIDALAQDEIPVTGTCCYEEGSICVVSPSSFANYYYKREGSCK